MLILKKFQHCSDNELLMILQWRNNPSVREQMINKDIISIDDHLNYVGNLDKRNDVDYRVIVYEDKYIGVINLTDIKKNSAELGLYKNPESIVKGAGPLLMDCIYQLAGQKGIKKLKLRVLKSNLKALHLYERFNFVKISEDMEYIYMEIVLDKKIFIVAELSANHDHNINIAKESIKAANETGVDAVKIQTYTADTITIDCQNKYFQIDKGTMWDGRTLYDLYKEAFTPWEWHAELRDYAESLGLTFFSTPFDFTAVDYLEKMNNPIYKIASFEITDIPLIEYAASKAKPIIISTGIAEMQEIKEAVDACRRVGNNDITLLKCTSSYPAPIDQANLLTMVNMKDTFDVKVGLSDHSMGSDIAIAAAALGAEVIEKHFILDRKIGGPDAAFSMEPDEFKKMVESIRNVEKALGKVTYQLSDKTRKNREFSRSLFIVEDIKIGDVFTVKNIRSIRPGYGLAPKYLQDVVGEKAKIDLKKGTPLTFEMFR